MNVITETLKGISLFIAACALFISSILGFIAWQQQNRNNAIQECYSTATVRYTNKDKAEVIEPVKSFYEQCLKDKGYQPVVE